MESFKLKDLKCTTFCEFPDTYWGDFDELQNLRADGTSFLLGYRGNLYSISVVEIIDYWDIDPSYTINRHKVRIWDLINNEPLGECSWSGPLTRVMPEIKAEIKRALIKINVEPTDFYK